MSNAQIFKGNWNEIKGQIREKWGDVTDDELDKVEGKSEQLVGLIQRNTGAAREEINKFLSSISDSGASMVEQASDSIRNHAGDATERVRDAAAYAQESAVELANQIGDQAAVGYEQAQEIVRRRPAESLAVCFGVGVLAGVVGGLLLRR
jgi:uncharacterized protein YjbJ (UPF0337 family)